MAGASLALNPLVLQRLGGLAATAQSVGRSTSAINNVASTAQQSFFNSSGSGSSASNPFSHVDPGNYLSPQRGATKYGVGFGTGLGGDAQTQQLFGKSADLAGLWAMGFDQSDPNNNYKLWAFHQDKMKTDNDYRNYVTKEASKNGWNLNDIQGITYGADWYYRDLARRMGKSNNFLDSTLGKIVSTALQVGLGAIPGVGPVLSAGLGAYTGQRNGGGILGGILGGLGGYTSGGLGASIAKNGISGTINNAINSVKGFFGSGSGLNPNAVPGLSTGILHPAGGGALIGSGQAAPLLGLGGAYTGGASNLASILGAGIGGVTGFAPTAASTTASIGGGLIPSNILGFTNSGAGTVANTTGGNMGFFDSVLNFLGNNAGDIIQAGVGLYGQNQANDALSSAAQSAAAGAQFKPYNVTTPAGSGAFSGQNAVASLSPQLQAELARLQGVTGQAYGAYQGFNPSNFSNNMYSAIKSYKAPEDVFQANDFLDRLYSSGQWGGTPGERALFNFTRGKQAEDNALRFQAHEAGGAESDRLFNNYMKALQGQTTLAASPAELLTLGGNFGGASAQAGANAAQFPWQAAQNSAIGSNNFWSYLAQGAGNLGQNVIDSWGNRNANRGVTYSGPLSPGYQYGPSVNFG